jgi:D(-)-tartrate dehydratase
MNRYAPEAAKEAAQAFAPYGLWWFEDVCDPLDFVTQAEVARIYEPPLAAGEELFSLADARNLIRYGGLRADRDVLLFDPVHCYGVPEYLRILQFAETHRWSRTSFYPHGGHLFSVHVAAALGLGGTESNPYSFQPFGGFADETTIEDGCVCPPNAPGIGFETRAPLHRALESTLEVV